MTRKGEALKIVKDETREKLKDFTKWGKRLFWIIPLLIVAAIALTSFYTVNENEQAVVTSFGKYTKTAIFFIKIARKVAHAMCCFVCRIVQRLN